MMKFFDALGLSPLQRRSSDAGLSSLSMMTRPSAGMSNATRRWQS
jgi:hypothetical protein